MRKDSLHDEKIKAHAMRPHKEEQSHICAFGTFGKDALSVLGTHGADSVPTAPVVVVHAARA